MPRYTLCDDGLALQEFWSGVPASINDFGNLLESCAGG
jgi:hypothetical protein